MTTTCQKPYTPGGQLGLLPGENLVDPFGTKTFIHGFKLIRFYDLMATNQT